MQFNFGQPNPLGIAVQMPLGGPAAAAAARLQLRHAFLLRQRMQLNGEEEPEVEKPFNPFKPHKLFEERPVAEWTEADVFQWWDHPKKGPSIGEIHKEKYRTMLKANRINGAALLGLDAESWMLLGITDEGHIEKIMASIEACKDIKVETDEGNEQGNEKEKEKTDEEGSLLSKKRKQPEGDEGSRKDKGKEKIKDEDEQKEKEKETEEPKNKRAKLAEILAESQEANEGRKESQGEGINAECPICMDEFPTMAMTFLECGHMYCRDCLGAYLDVRINSKEFPIPCPNPKCGKEVEPQEIKGIVSEELMKKYEAFSLTSVVEKNRDLYSCCPTLGCDYFFIWLKGDDPHFRCPKCNKHYCLNCQTDYHKGKTCLEFREWVYKHSLYHLLNKKADELFQEHAMGKKYKKCPTCNFWTVKVDGCNSMTCTCGNHFCYACGKAECNGYDCPAQSEVGDEEDEGEGEGGGEDDY